MTRPGAGLYEMIRRGTGSYRLGRGPSLNRGGLGWRACTLAALLWCFLGGVIAAPSWAGWSRTTIVNEPGSCGAAPPGEPVFDVHGARWVACELFGGTKGLYVGRLNSHYHLTAAHLVPGTLGFRVVATSLAIDTAGIGVLAWSYAEPDIGAFAPHPYGVAAVTWRPGHTLAAANVLSAPNGNFGFAPAVAINSRGTAVVMFQDQQGVEAARLQSDRVLGVEQLAATSEAAQDIQLLACEGDGFQASFALAGREGEEQPSTLHQVTVESAHASSDGIFSVESPIAIPLQLSPHLSPLYDSAWELGLHSDARGDQVLTWGASGPTGVGAYVESRRAGHPFTAPQLVGRPPAPVATLQSAIGPTGRFTIVWTGAHSIQATTGEVGGALSRPKLMATHALIGLQLAVIPDGRTIALWGQEILGEQGPIEEAISTDGLHFTPGRAISKTSTRIHHCGSPKLLLERRSNVLAEWVCSAATNSNGSTRPVVEFARYRP